MASASHKQYRVSDFRTSPTRHSLSSTSHSPVSERHPQLPHRMSRGASSDSVSSLSRRPPRSNDDIVIVVMGMTGSGKSSFVNQISQEDVQVGHSLCSSTSEVQLASFRTSASGGNAGRAGILIDTPGFDDTNRSDTEILKEIATFLAKLYRDGTYVTGIIYMHRITDVRMQGSSIKNLEVFRKLCGEQCFPQVALVSTMWQTLKGTESEKVGNAREEELKRKQEFWGDMVAGGARTFRYYDDAKSAISIMNWFIGMPKKLKLNIQAEMVDFKLSLDQTEAGDYLGKDFVKVKKKYKQEIKALTNQIREAEDDDDGSMKDFLVSQQREAKSKLVDTQQELEDLRIDLPELVVQKAPEYAARISQMEMEQMIEVEEEDNSGDEIKIQKLENHIEELETDYRLIEKQKNQEIESIKRQDRARAKDMLKQLEKRHNEELRQVTAELHSEQEKRRDAENEAKFERARRRPPKLEFMRRHFSRQGSSTDNYHGAGDRSIVASPRAMRDDRYAPAPAHGIGRATTWEQQLPGPASQLQMMVFDAEENELTMRPLRRTKTGEERVKTPPRGGATDSSRHKR